jgi:hypothetical protein
VPCAPLAGGAGRQAPAIAGGFVGGLGYGSADPEPTGAILMLSDFPPDSLQYALATERDDAEPFRPARDGAECR